MSGKERTFIKASKGFDRAYLFISYAHVDRIKVEGILNILYRRGFRIWYDQSGAGIPAGDGWYETIVKRIENSSSFLAFISNATVHRPIVIDEIQRALKKKQEYPDYKVVFVFLERVSSEGFPDEIKKEIQNNQFIDFKKRGGITKEFTEVLCDVRWPETIINQEYRLSHGIEPWSPDTAEDVDIRDDISWFDDTLPLSVNNSKKHTLQTDSGSIDYYRVSPDEIDPNTVYPTVMDNQWVPEELYSLDLFYLEGVRGKTIAPIITQRQQQEILRSLVHNRQIIVNRASILNSKVFTDWYVSDHSEYPAFIRLLDHAAIVLFLFKEKSPVDFPGNFEIPEENKTAWEKVCRDTTVCCLRMDWESEESNAYETDLIVYSFRNFCLTLADDDYILRSLEQIFQIPETDITGNNRDRAHFVKLWQDVQKDVLRYRKTLEKENKKGNYNREQFYKSFLIDPRKSTANDGILDRGKSPFVKELKQTVDLFYSANLPLALDIRPLLPTDAPLHLDTLTVNHNVRNYREVEIDELLFSVSEFHSSFLSDSIYLPQNQAFSLGNIADLREMREWREYMRAVTEGKKRASLDQLDFFDTKKVWDHYTQFLSAAQALLPDMDWKQSTAAISIIFRFENIELTTVYECNRIRYRIGACAGDAQKTLNRKSSLCVDYICCDALSSDRQNLLVTELRLFEGFTHTTGYEAYSKLIDHFRSQKKYTEDTINQ